MGLGAARARPVCRLPSSRGARRAVRADPSGRGATHARLSRPGHQVAAAHGALARRATDDRGPRGRLRCLGRRTCTSGRAVWRRLSAHEPDFVAVAERFLETPYLWGGRTSEGIDCSGLVQTALTAAGDRLAARQRHDGGGAWRAARRRRPRRRSRAAISCSGKAMSGSCAIPETLLHANGWHMKAVSEPLDAGARPDRRQWRRRGHERRRSGRLARARCTASSPVGEMAAAILLATAREPTSCRRCQDRRSGC